MKPTRPPLQAPSFRQLHNSQSGVDQVVLDLFASEGAPSPAETRPACIEGPAGAPQFHPRRMPQLQLRVACPSEDGAKRTRTPLWRPFKALDE